MALANPVVVPAAEPQLPGRSECIQAFEHDFDYLCRTLRRLGTPDRDVEDAVHEVFIILFRRWKDYDVTRPFRPWLFGIARRVVAANRRRWNREISMTTGEPADHAADAEQAFVAGEARAMLLAALQSIPPKRREVLIMHDIDNLSIRDAADVLSIPVFTAYSRLRKARKELAIAVRGLQGKGRDR